MRCREAREKLSSLADESLAAEETQALREHLSRCSDCAQLASAERLLTADMLQLRRVQLSRPLTVEQVRERITIREESEKKTSLGVRIMRQIGENVRRRPRLSIASAALSVLLLMSILVPVKTQQAIGYEVAFAAPATGLQLNQENAEKMLAALDLGDACVKVRKSETGVEYRIAPLADADQVQRLVAVLDSLGGAKGRRVLARAQPGEKQTIWQLLLNESSLTSDSSPAPADRAAPARIKLDVGLDDLPEDDFTLWMPVGDQPDDSMVGILMDRQDKTTTIWLLGMESSFEPDERGWHPLLNGNTELTTTTPDGRRMTFDLADIHDVRELEEMGYNFWLMEFDTPGQIPIPGMGPKLNEIEPNPFFDKTIIEYMVPRAHEVRVQILDKQGREIRTLLEQIELAGIYQVIWDGRDAEGNRVVPGTYLCSFIAGDYVETQEIKLER